MFNSSNGLPPFLEIPGQARDDVGGRLFGFPTEILKQVQDDVGRAGTKRGVFVPERPLGSNRGTKTRCFVPETAKGMQR